MRYGDRITRLGTKMYVLFLVMSLAVWRILELQHADEARTYMMLF